MHPPLRLQVSDIVSSLASCSAISTEATSSSILDLKTFIRISRVLFQPFVWKAELLNPEVSGRQYDQRRKLQEALDKEEWYATAEDFTRVWTNVFRHRIKLDQRVRQSLLTPAAQICVEVATQPGSSLDKNVNPVFTCSGLYGEMSSHTNQPSSRSDVVARLFESVRCRCAAETT